MRTLVIYHGNCYDGFTAAFVAYKALGADADFFAGVYGEPPPDVRGRDVLILDFSYPRDVMERMAEEANTLLVYDHHKTAQAACAGLPFCRFDMDRSGCRMAWDAFFPAAPPAVLLRIEDRDLWRKEYPDTETVHCHVASLPFTFAAWGELFATPFDDILASGAAMLRLLRSWIEKVSAHAKVAQSNGHRIVVVNAPYPNSTELLNHLLTKHPEADYALGWFRRASGDYQCSLRSRPGFDVSAIATAHGGGGHKTAAGYYTKEVPA
jgi:oligoribonuclease NrnB/cAMP/cGMP phosphodiesterase (DHH superfamily)